MLWSGPLGSLNIDLSYETESMTFPRWFVSNRTSFEFSEKHWEMEVIKYISVKLEIPVLTTRVLTLTGSIQLLKRLM